MFATQKMTLCAHPDTFFERLLSDNWDADKPHNTPETAIFLDRNPDHFAVILDYLRYGHFIIPDDDDRFQMLLIDVDFFNLQSMKIILERAFHNFEIFFEIKLLKLVRSDIIPYRTVLRRMGVNSKFRDMVDREIDEGRGTKTNPIELTVALKDLTSVQLDLEILACLIEYVKGGDMKRHCIAELKLMGNILTDLGISHTVLNGAMLAKCHK